MRIGIMGGTLDPVHRGHVEIALKVRQELALDSVMLLPAGDPPHKGKTTPKIDRMRMAEIAAAEHEGLFASDIEIKREGTTFTVDTLEQLSEEKSFDYQQSRVKQSPRDKGEVSAVPYTCEQEYDKEIYVCTELSASVSAERNIDVFSEPG